MEPRTAPAAERNKEPILSVLRAILPGRGLVLEVASGTGQHAVHVARALPGLTWQPSDPDPEMRASIAAWADRLGLPNLRPPLALDVLAAPWPIAAADAVVCINMIHIAPWAATPALMAGTARVLGAGGILFLYGPFRREDRPTAPSNEAFDAGLRRADPAWGLRDLGEVAGIARLHGLDLRAVTEMPANNLAVTFTATRGRENP